MSWRTVGNLARRAVSLANPLTGTTLRAIERGGGLASVPGAALDTLKQNQRDAITLAPLALAPGVGTALASKVGAGTAAATAGNGVVSPGLMDAIRQSVGQTAAAAPRGMGGRVMDALRGVTGLAGAAARNPDTLRTITGAVGSGLGAVQDQRRFDAQQRLRQTQLDDDLATTRQQREQRAAEFARLQRQDAALSPQRDQIVRQLLSRVGGG